MKPTRCFACLVGIILVLSLAASPLQSTDSSAPPDHTVKLIFIHHSTGENLLRDDYGGLGLALSQNNYFVSDTNYGWGPDAIGDRTDIPDWPEWFASDGTPRYMEALFNENGQNSSYTRTLDDPGGENEIILFKSCFPNSALEGSPDDPPDPEGWLTVGHAKWVYNEILPYFASRPDKLFVILTAPPLSDGTYAENARAFNNWLVNDWLSENNYPLANVAVFDFYNVLTDPNAHHRFIDGQVEYTSASRNTLYYPSEDDHPSVQGSRKAVEEFVPLLNVFYHRWQSGETSAPPAQVTSEPALGAATPPPLIASNPLTGVLDDFEGAPPAGTSGWEGFCQDSADICLECRVEQGVAHAGASALKFNFDAPATTWATCGFYFDSVQTWDVGQGVSFYLRANNAGIPFDIDVYGGDPGARTTYYFHTQTPAESVDGWALIEVRWEQIVRTEWEENPGTPLNPAEITGFSFGINAPENSRLTGTLWVDDLSLLGTAAPASTPSASVTELPPSPPPTEPEPASRLPCGGALILPFALIGLVSWKRNRT